jgi:RimJ/RimL family protein N-acetyltransferase
VKRIGFANAFVRLEPLAVGHTDALLAAATADRATFELAPVPRDRAEMEAYVSRALEDEAAGRAAPFAVVRLGRGGELVVGSIRFMSLEWWTWPAGPVVVPGEPRVPGVGDPPDVVEIGHAWLAPGAQRTAVFTATCLLLMKHAFETWRVHRLTLKTDARNQRSRAAITRLGGHFEGILRAHLPAADGRVRDTAMFSILRGEWDGVRIRLESALASPHSSGEAE